jgi:hypothetical protein
MFLLILFVGTKADRKGTKEVTRKKKKQKESDLRSQKRPARKNKRIKKNKSFRRKIKKMA